jgi:hypothetical protein
VVAGRAVIVSTGVPVRLVQLFVGVKLLRVEQWFVKVAYRICAMSGVAVSLPPQLTSSSAPNVTKLVLQNSTGVTREQTYCSLVVC